MKNVHRDIVRLFLVIAMSALFMSLSVFEYKYWI